MDQEAASERPLEPAAASKEKLILLKPEA